jgi:uncharacterized protein (TIGR00269 family)
MELSISSDIRLIELLHSLGICPEAVLLSINGELVPETSLAKGGDKLQIIFYKHVPPTMASQDLKGHWSKAESKDSCDLCDSPPVSYLPQSKQHLCARHFISFFDRRVKKTIREHKMLEKGDNVGIGLSGGKDSHVLLRSLARLKKSLPFDLIALTIDEGIPGYRDKAVDKARKLCGELGIEQHVFSFKDEYDITMFDIGSKGKENLCSYCGVLRRKILNSKARELGLDKLAIGHNLDDVAQTAMLNMVRNEPMRFARFNQPLVSDARMVPRVRPLRDIREKEVASYAFLVGHRHSSGCCCPFAKSALRMSVRHELNSLEDKHPGSKTKMAASFDILQKIVHDSISKEELKMGTCKECGEPCSKDLCMTCRMLAGLRT